MADKKYLDHRKKPPFRCGYCSTETGKMQLAAQAVYSVGKRFASEVDDENG